MPRGIPSKRNKDRKMTKFNAEIGQEYRPKFNLIKNKLFGLHEDYETPTNGDVFELLVDYYLKNENKEN